MNLKKILLDFDAAREKFRAFEFAYRLLRPDDLRYLRERSSAYKKAVSAVQELILPAVLKNCINCPFGTCCRLSSPQLKIYIARSVGCFDLVDYLLVRCDTELPAPDFGNAKKNLCAFWDNGCRLSPDCRSITCLQFFCKPLRRELDMAFVGKRISELQSILDDFSFGRLLCKTELP